MTPKKPTLPLHSHAHQAHLKNISLAPRPAPPKSSWWAEPLSRAEFQERQQVANDRMHQRKAPTKQYVR